MADFRATPKWKELSASIMQELDMDKVALKIREGLRVELGQWDLEAVGEMVYLAGEKWLARDVEWMLIEGIERRFEWDGESGVYDLVGRFTEKAPDHLRGKKFVRDWKTTGSGLDEKWVQRYTDSWQWRVYLYNQEAEVMLYSGVSRGGDTREFSLGRPVNLEEQVRTQMLGLGLMRDSLVESGALVYPMNRPHACNAYGRECENIMACRNWGMPKQALEGWNWSPSSMDGFLLCPERMRRDQLRKLAGEERAAGYDAEIGSAFHRGIAEVYRQVWGLEEVGGSEVEGEKA